MTDEYIETKIKNVSIEDIGSGFYTLRIGEEITHLEIKAIRKITNSQKTDNLAGVDYKYIIESTEGKILVVNSWVLWKKIAAVLKEAGKIRVALRLQHTGFEQYSVNLLP
ncbi:MAG: hypothetical protein R3F48_12690 [Candidatus Zixiibacteriota bacterium]